MMRRCLPLMGLVLAGWALAGSQLPDLPEPVTNNGVAHLEADGEHFLASFMGLAEAKDWQAAHNKAWVLKIGEKSWQPVEPVPASMSPEGRLATTVAGIGDTAYIFGGYTVEQDHSETSSPDVYAFKVPEMEYQKLPDMPVPVDDSVALVHQNRYIYLVSGWHNHGNVNLVQVFDTQTRQWQQASPFPGKPVFGHAGAIIENQMILCDGVAVVPQLMTKRTFAAEPACFKGIINAADPTRIDWQKIEHPTGEARYRMAAASVKGKAVFIGGSSNPYNYNGIGYNGEPSEPSSDVWVYHPKENRWQLGQSSQATMDHRGLLVMGHKLLVIGGMTRQQQVLDKITTYPVIGD
ncbi:hypothetical protein HMF8227_00987 [Saliniradius amylolyticus]|uniref:N-acetylneuraminate epimerase n=2 Tax=Saliniradius amylolyticus TaxID=2183582 RepID=A0A2S2E2J1_9ALTE|nr:hypothetical protein HMF8227_00987 [Saliniradius amylolyticus]